MADVSLTDEEIQGLITVTKRALKPSRDVEEGKYRRRDYKLRSDAGDEFSIFYRQHLEMVEDFSVGLVWHSKTGESVTLLRCNGASHRHKNHIERTQFGQGNFHIHVATQRYMDRGSNPEHFAEVTDEYQSIDGALWTLCRICNVVGITAPPENRDLFADGRPH